MTLPVPTSQIDPAFAELLVDYSLEALEAEAGAVVGVWPDGTIAMLSRKWFEFAADNDGAEVVERWGLGQSLLTGISGGLRDYYAEVFSGVLRSNDPWAQTYSCHSPRVDREYHLRVVPLCGKGLLLVHSLSASCSNTARPGSTFAPALYQDEHGLVHQCSNCRRIRRRSGAWEWVPDLVCQTKLSVSHGLCGPCYGQYSAAITHYFRVDGVGQ